MKYLQQTKVEKKVILDKKDKRILSILSQNSRTPVSAIARKVQLSRDAVKYRIDQLEKRGIIQGYRTIVDVGKFGYDAYHLFLQLNRPGSKSEEEFIEKLQSYPFVRAVLKFSGKYDFEVALVAKSVKDFDNIITKISNECGQLKNYEIAIITKGVVARTFPKKLLDYETKIVKEKETKVDRKDVKILKELGENATLPLYKIASRVKLSPDAVNYRIKKMVEGGIIKGFIPVINYAAISYNVYAILLNLQEMNVEKEVKLNAFLKNDENVLWAVKTIGKYNAIIYICSKSTDELHETITALRKLLPDEIKEYEALIAYEEYKYRYFPECLFL